LQGAYTASRAGSKRLTAKLNAKDFEFEIELIALGHNVQNIDNSDNEVGDVIILSAGMDLKTESVAGVRKFEV
jgi:hypothetical protein